MNKLFIFFPTLIQDKINYYIWRFNIDKVIKEYRRIWLSNSIFIMRPGYNTRSFREPDDMTIYKKIYHYDHVGNLWITTGYELPYNYFFSSGKHHLLAFKN